MALYDYVDRRRRGGLDSLLTAFDEMQLNGEFSEVIKGKMSELVPELWEEWRVTTSDTTSYLVSLDGEKIRAFWIEHQAVNKHLET